MIKDSARKILVTFMAVSLVLSFSISSFAGYSFQEDGDAINESFSGTNYVYTNGVYVGEMGAIDAYMDNYGNTYNGTNIIDATAYPGVGQDDESTYNGTLTVTANDLMSSKTTVDDATVNASTTVTANEVLTDNNLNAGVQFNNSTFNNDVSLNGSGDVNLSGSTISNLVLGNIPQMNYLIAQIMLLGECLFSDNVTSNANGAAPALTFSATYNGTTVTRPALQYSIPFVQYNTSTNVYSSTLYRYRSGLMKMWSYYFQLWPNIIFANISRIVDELEENFELYWSAYLPNKDLAQAQYWIAYNTDTDSYDSVNLATVYGYITWYLGQMYIQGNEAATDISQSVSNLSDTLTDFETKEGQINNSIKSSLNNVDSFFQLPAVTAASTVIGWLQYMWVSLGTFQAVTIIAWALVILTIVTGFYKVKRITV